jgi:hypothetical protein
VRSTFLFTDGLANVGITGVDKLCSAAEAVLGELGDSRCTLSTFGFGKDHNADLLQGLAQVGHGVYSYVEDEDKIGQAFGQGLGGLLTTTHQNVKLSLELAPTVTVKKTCTDYVVEGPSASSNAAASVLNITLGDMFAEERRDILVSLTVPSVAAEGTAMLGQLRAKGFSLIANRTEETAANTVWVERSNAAAAACTPEACHEQVVRHRNRYLTTDALRSARLAAQGGDFAGARRHLEVAADGISKAPLTTQGDSISLGFLEDLSDCRRDLMRQDTYVAIGSKKMAAMQQSHATQRACFGQDFSHAYTNFTMRSMTKAFKDQVSR